MPTCQHCKNTWSWKQTVKKTFTLNPRMICPHCGKFQYQTRKSKAKSSLFNAVILLPLLLQIFTDMPGAILLGLYPVLFIFVVLVSPFLVKTSNKEA